jgi:hypothetical protein
LSDREIKREQIHADMLQTMKTVMMDIRKEEHSDERKRMFIFEELDKIIIYEGDVDRELVTMTSRFIHTSIDAFKYALGGNYFPILHRINFFVAKFERSFDCRIAPPEFILDCYHNLIFNFKLLLDPLHQQAVFEELQEKKQTRKAFLKIGGPAQDIVLGAEQAVMHKDIENQEEEMKGQPREEDMPEDEDEFGEEEDEEEDEYYTRRQPKRR